MSPGGVTAAGSLTVNWDPATPESGEIIAYQGGFVTDANASPTDLVAPGSIGAPGPDATYVFKVRAVGDDLSEGPYATSAPVTIDRTAPDVSGATPGGPSGVDGWFRAGLTFTFTCVDANITVAACTVPWTGAQGSFTAGSQSLPVTDQAGNTAFGLLPAFKFDSAAPPIADLVAPISLVPSEPTFRWFQRRLADPADLSGADEYRVQYRLADDSDGTFTTLAIVPEPGGQLVERTAVRGQGLTEAATPPPLPENVAIDWRVRVVDKAGNITSGQTRTFTIDPTVPPAPEITGGPVGPTANTTPTFTWQGNGDKFRWSVVPSGSQATIRGDDTQAKQVTVGRLDDGAYTFRLTQFTAAGRESAQAIQSFIVDTTPPAAPLITGRPTFPSVTDAIFTWTSEPGAYSRWSVLDANGNVVVSPTDTPVNSATLPQLADGTYSFQLQQIDVAGNISPATVEPFTVIAPLVPPSGGNGTITILPKQNAKRLQPKAGKILTSRTPVLRWSRGPKGTKLFNLQVFRVTTAKGTRTPKVTKILSAFPKGRSFRVPRGKTAPKACYVWRVWPYTGREFTPKPLGVSNYCIASKKVLAKKARIIAQRKAAKARSRSLR